jgi:hypothetical protein
MTEPIRIANCSGFYGDRLSAAREMVEGGPIDVLTGDWLAELTMLILARTQAKRPGGGYARSVAAQMEQVMRTCLDRGIKVVSNAGGLDPDGCAEAVAQVADRLGLSPTIAYVSGDNILGRLDELVAAGVDLAHFETGEAVVTRRDSSAPARTSVAGASSKRYSVAPTSSSPDAPPTPPSCAGRPRGTTVGPVTTGMHWPVRSSPATSSSAAPRRRAATTPSSPRCPA